MHLHSLLILPLLGAAVVLPRPSWAGYPPLVVCPQSHGVTAQTCVDGTDAGRGDAPPVHILLAVPAPCVHPGGHTSQTGNAEMFDAEAQMPVHTGMALSSLCVVPHFQPDCLPPMALAVNSVAGTDTTPNNGRPTCMLR